MTSGNRSSFLGKVTMEAEEKPTVQPCSIKKALKESPPQCHHASSSNGLAIAEVVSKKEESIINSTEDNVDDDYLDSFPPGYRFCPLDEELVLYYLKKKVMNEPLPQNRIMEVNLYRHNPEKLAEQYKQYGEKEWYFFTPRDKKYRNGTRPNRAAGDGYWKATGADREVRFKGHIVGYRKALVFYRGKPPKGDKTSWIMHEYRVNDPPPCKRVYNDMRLDDWVLCRIYKKVDKSVRTQSKNEYRSSPLIHSEDTNESTNLDYDYNNVADMMDYSNTIDSLMHQSFPEGSLINFQHTVNDQILTSLPMKYSNENDRVEQDEIWSVANLDFASQLDFYNGTYVEPLINIDNILSVDTENKISPNSRMNGRG